MSLVEMIPPSVKEVLRSVLSIPYRGRNRWCPICGKSSRKFARSGIVPRADAKCMHCGALERHRLVWLYLRRRTALFDGRVGAMLHVAAEPSLQKPLQSHLGSAYVTADLEDPRAMVRMDITDIKYPDESFDVIYCSHVLEHVPDDRRAMREFRRTLKPGGWALLLVPITATTTFEDPTVTDPKERLRLFGQKDHVRRYGPDYVDRLRDEGFEVQVSRSEDFLSPEEIHRMGITEAAGEIYHCTKRCR